MEAEITLEYDDEGVAESVAKAVSPDNSKTPPGLSIKTFREGKKVLTRVNYTGRIQTFIATIDDLLFCVSLAEKTLQLIKKSNYRVTT